MSYTIHHCHDWSAEQMAPYHAALKAAMCQFVARFADDVTWEDLARAIAAGEKQLWLILDENQGFVAFVTSQTEVTPSGKKRLLLLELAGRGGVALVEMLGSIEAWAREHDIHEICPIGRVGWRRALAKRGYRPLMSKYGKELK